MTKTLPKPAPVKPAPSIDGVALAARVLVGLLLVVSGALKASRPAEEFAFVIDAYDLLPQGMSLAVAAFLPWIELLVGWSLLFGYFTREAAAAAFGLSVTFFGALASTKLRGYDLPNCGCFGSAVHLPIWATMLVDLSMGALSFLAFRKGPGGPSLDNWAAGAHT